MLMKTKIQVSEQDIIGSCIANLIDQGRISECMNYLQTGLVTVINLIDLKNTGCTTELELFDQVNEEMKKQ